MDFLDRLIDFIEDNIKLDTIIEVGKLSKEKHSIAIRPTPSSIPIRYIDRDKIREYTFQIIVKDPNQLKIIMLLEEITSLLDGLSSNSIVSNNDSFTFIKCEAYVLPNYLEVTDHEEYIYSAMFIAELKGGN